MKFMPNGLDLFGEREDDSFANGWGKKGDPPFTEKGKIMCL